MLEARHSRGFRELFPQGMPEPADELYAALGRPPRLQCQGRQWPSGYLSRLPGSLRPLLPSLIFSRVLHLVPLFQVLLVTKQQVVCHGWAHFRIADRAPAKRHARFCWLPERTRLPWGSRFHRETQGSAAGWERRRWRFGVIGGIVRSRWRRSELQVLK